MSSTTSYLVFFCVITLLIIYCDALQCYQCGQYNEGVGSITPCTDYSAESARHHLKECPRKTDKFCIKYVSELSTVRDCVAECTEKEVWETRTYCCNENGCNGSTSIMMASSTSFITLTLSLIFILILKKQ